MNNLSVLRDLVIIISFTGRRTTRRGRCQAPDLRLDTLEHQRDQTFCYRASDTAVLGGDRERSTAPRR